MTIECPYVRMFWDVILRAIMSTTALDIRQVRHAATVGTNELLMEARAAAITGLRSLSPTMVDRKTGSVAFRIMVHEALRIVIEARDRNADVWRPGLRTHSVRTMYTALLRRFSQVARDRRRQAYQQETKLAIKYPGWKPSEGEGPVEEWGKEFVQSGYMTEVDGRLQCALPESVDSVEGCWAAAALDTVRAATLIDTRQLNDRPVRLVLTIAPHARTTTCPATRPPAPLPLSTWAGYCDGSYTPQKHPRNVELAGWASAIVRGGDGQADVGATVVAEGWGPVVLDEDAPQFLGATRLTNNTAELTGLIETLLILRRALDAGAACDTFIARPDSMYAVDIATGEAHPKTNLELARFARGVWRDMHARLGGRLYRSHVRGHSNRSPDNKRCNIRVDAQANVGSQGVVGAQGGPWEAWPWPAEYGMYSQVKRFVVRAHRMISTRVTGQERWSRLYPVSTAPRCAACAQAVAICRKSRTVRFMSMIAASASIHMISVTRRRLANMSKIITSLAHARGSMRCEYDELYSHCAGLPGLIQR